MTPLPPPHPKTNNEPGAVEANSSTTSILLATVSTPPSEPSSSALLLKLFVNPSLAEILTRDWLKAHSKQNHQPCGFDLPGPFSERLQKQSGHTSRLLSWQYRGYRNVDPMIKQQKAIPVCVICKVGYNHACSIKEVASGQLSSGAFYFTMRSCEYLKVTTKVENRQTKLLCIINIRFFNRNCLGEHNDPRLYMSRSISITFEFQKNDERNDIVTMHRTGDHLMFPIVAWAAVVQHVLSYPYNTTSYQFDLSIACLCNILYHVCTVLAFCFM
jgi:hypothetical protein